MDNKPPARPASLLTGHRVRKTKHLSRIKKPKEKRPKQDEDENDHEENQEIHDVDEGSDAVKEHPQKKQKHPPPPRPAKRSRSIDPMTLRQEVETDIFTLEATEALKDVRTDYSNLDHMEKALRALRKLFMKLDEQNIDLQDELPACLSLQNAKQSQIKFRFKHPLSVKLVGSYALHTVASIHRNVDLAVEIPPECFSASKDLKNHRYTDKRALYLLQLALAIEQNLADTFEVRFAPWQGDTSRPIVLLKLKDCSDYLAEFDIRILPVVSSTTFDASKLLPNVNNCHRNSHPDEPQPPTPHYNHNILEDMHVLDNLTMLHETFSSTSPAIIDALLLLKTWLALRNTEHFVDNFSGFHMSALVAHLLKQRRLGTHHTSVQAFRIVLEFIASSSATPALSMSPDSPPADLLALFSAAFPVVLLDPTLKLNLWARVSAQAWRELQREAQLAITELAGQNPDALPLLLQRSVRFAVRFDAYARVQLPKESAEPSLAELNALCDLPFEIYQRERLYELLTRGLGSRALQLRVTIAAAQPWLISAIAPASPTEASVGMLLNAESAFRVLDLGPSPEQKEAAAEFREWWGERAELRRFKDGSILECVVWEESGAASSIHNVLHRVICHVLARHANVPPSGVRFYDDQLAFALHRNGRDLRNTSATVIALFDRFQRQVRALPDLRLPVRTMHPTSAVFRYMEPWPVQPLPKNATGVIHTQPLDVVMQLESSGAWPDDVQAIRAVRAAFYIHLAQLINQHLSWQTQVTVEFLDVWCEGFVFRLHIHHERELVLLERADLTSAVARRLRKRQVLRPLHNSTLHGIYARYPAIGPAVRLAKTWVHSHMLSGHIGDEVIELLMTAVFTRHAPFNPPVSPLIAFVRFLHLLSHHNWGAFALVIDPTGELGTEGVRVAQEAYDKLRATNSTAPALFLATPYDRTTSFWTKRKPSRMILHRLCAFAMHAENLLSSFLEGNLLESDLSSIFSVSLRECSVLIRLSDQAWPARQKRGRDPKNLSSPAETIVGFEPVRLFVKELKRRYGSLALFFYNAMEGDTIGVVWRPQAKQKRPFKVSTVEYSRADPRHESVTTNWEEIVHDIRVIGGVLVKAVEMV